MSIALLVVTDGRDRYLADCVASLDALHGPLAERWMYDDTGDDGYRTHLAERYAQFRHINGGPRQGFGGAIRAAWSRLAKDSDAAWIVHVEQDFTFNRPVDLGAMAAVITSRPYLAQMALRRQAWNPQETAAGGIVEQHPHDYLDKHDMVLGVSWLEHRRFFTTNPCLYRRSLLDVGWPEGDQSEGHFGRHLLAHGTPETAGSLVRFGYWGARTDPPWVTHIGHQRSGTGY
jgi:hypothetical protein